MERKELEEALGKKRCLLLEGEITEEEAERLRAWIRFLNLQSNEEIKLNINSKGGDVASALLLYDEILRSNAPVIGIVDGECSSVAIVVLQAAKKRLATRHSFFFLHPISIDFGKIVFDEKIYKKIREALERGRKRQELIRQILAKKTNKTPQEIQLLEKEEKMITAEKAKELGLIDEIDDGEYKI
jgi:ATP-dependent Clp protease protease subunit